nr:hypothetical protein [uncultured Mediterranean phage uvMED]
MKLIKFIWFVALGGIVMGVINSCEDKSVIAQHTDPPPVLPPVEVVKAPQWTCPDCNDAEKLVLKELQDKTNITDRNALATILGNIKQESNFRSNICEGGEIVQYHNCNVGGYGLIQWTSPQRYDGLGSFCSKYKCDPSSLSGQVRYMINEKTFRIALPRFEQNRQTMQHYMSAAYRWLGWGIEGNRSLYSYQYTRRLVLDKV